MLSNKAFNSQDATVQYLNLLRYNTIWRPGLTFSQTIPRFSSQSFSLSQGQIVGTCQVSFHSKFIKLCPLQQHVLFQCTSSLSLFFLTLFLFYRPDTVYTCICIGTCKHFPFLPMWSWSSAESFVFLKKTSWLWQRSSYFPSAWHFNLPQYAFLSLAFWSFGRIIGCIFKFDKQIYHQQVLIENRNHPNLCKIEQVELFLLSSTIIRFNFW